MISQSEQLQAIDAQLQTHPRNDIVEAIMQARAGIKSTFDPKSTIQVGDVIPPFTLRNALGEDVTSSDLLAKGPLLITFYRGSWCPYCNVALHHLQLHLAEFKAKGVTLVAISPELPDTSLTTTEKQNLEFPVLSDVDNKFAHQLGIVWQQPQSMQIVFDHFGHDMTKRNGQWDLKVPLPASLLVDGKGVVRNLFVDPDYSKRLDPETALEWIEAL